MTMRVVVPGLIAIAMGQHWIEAQARVASPRIELSGQVLSAADDTPVTGAVVVAIDDENGTRAGTTDTGSEGRFVLSVAEGRYRLTSSHAGFLMGELGATAPKRIGTPIAVSSSDAPERLTIRLYPYASVSGRVTRSAGPSVDALVIARKCVSLDCAIVATATASRTNNEGDYHLDTLEPGRYVFSAVSPITGTFGAAPDSPGPSGASFRFVPSFYPGTSVPAERAEVDVSAGGHHRLNDWQLSPVRVYAVSGTVVAPSSVDLQVLTFSAEIRHSAGSAESVATERPLRVDTNGTIRIAGLPDGAYDIRLRTDAPRDTVRSPSSSWYADATVLVSGAEVTGVPFLLHGFGAVTGSVRFESSHGAPLPLSRDLRITHSPPQTSARGRRWSSIGTPAVRLDGTFSITTLEEGTHLLVADVAGPAAAWVDWFPADLLDGPGHVDITPAAPSRVVLRFLDQAARVSGRLAAPNRKGQFIVIFPRDAKLRQPTSFRIQQVRPDNRGYFRFSRLVPGEYCLVTVDDVDSDYLYDPGYLERLSTGTTSTWVLVTGNNDVSLPAQGGRCQ